ncbi:MAG: ParB/RepB/Spo0J family partition protein [Candidatus Omnitrophota bacterium]
MEKRALGKGLSALISSQRTVADVLKKEISYETAKSDEKDVSFLDITKLVPNRFQPRVDFNTEHLQELIDSIKEKGVLAPILVRPAGDHYEIIAGERRFRAAKAVKLKKVPVVIKAVDDKEALVLSIVENVQRQELNPLEEAQAFSRLMKEFSFTQEEVAQAVSKDRSTVANMLRLLNLPGEVQKAIGQGTLSFGHGKALLGLDSVPQQIKMTKLVLSNSLSVRELENYISNIRLKSIKNKRVAKDKDPYIVDLENKLQGILGTKIRIFPYKKRGKIQIEYFSNTDRERIIEILCSVKG